MFIVLLLFVLRFVVGIVVVVVPWISSLALWLLCVDTVNMLLPLLPLHVELLMGMVLMLLVLLRCGFLL